MAVLAVQLAGPFLTAQLDDATRGLMLGHIVGFGGGARLTGCETQFGGGCPVRVMATAVGYPGLGALRSGGGPAFLVAAGPQGQ